MDGYNAAAWLVDRHVDAGRGDRVAIRCNGSSLTYADVQQEVFRAQHALDELGIVEGDRIVLVVNDEPAFAAWFLGAQRSGVVAVPISTMLTGDELAAIVADAGARAVVVSAPFADHLARITTSAPSVEHAVVIGGDDGDVGVPVHGWDGFTDHTPLDVAATTADSPGFWLYSSGTTGLPKGVMHRHGNLQATADTYAAGVLRVTEDDRCLSVAKLFFAYGLGNSLTFPFAVGATAVLEPGRPTPAGMVELVATERPTLFFASPGFVAALLDTDAPRDAFAERAGDGDGGGVPAGRPAATVQRSLRPSRARRHRLDRGAAHLPVQHAGGAAPGHQRLAGSRLRGDAARRQRRRGHGRRHAGLPPRPRAVGRGGVLAAAGCDRRRVPPRRLAAHRRRLHALATTRRGRSSAATTT